MKSSVAHQSVFFLQICNSQANLKLMSGTEVVSSAAFQREFFAGQELETYEFTLTFDIFKGIFSDIIKSENMFTEVASTTIHAICVVVFDAISNDDVIQTLQQLLFDKLLASENAQQYALLVRLNERLETELDSLEDAMKLLREEVFKLKLHCLDKNDTCDKHYLKIRTVLEKSVSDLGIQDQRIMDKLGSIASRLGNAAKGGTESDAGFINAASVMIAIKKELGKALESQLPSEIQPLQFYKNIHALIVPLTVLCGCMGLKAFFKIGICFIKLCRKDVVSASTEWAGSSKEDREMLNGILEALISDNHCFGDRLLFEAIPRQSPKIDCDKTVYQDLPLAPPSNGRVSRADEEMASSKSTHQMTPGRQAKFSPGANSCLTPHSAKMLRRTVSPIRSSQKASQLLLLEAPQDLMLSPDRNPNGTPPEDSEEAVTRSYADREYRRLQSILKNARDSACRQWSTSATGINESPGPDIALEDAWKPTDTAAFSSPSPTGKTPAAHTPFTPDSVENDTNDNNEIQDPFGCTLDPELARKRALVRIRRKRNFDQKKQQPTQQEWDKENQVPNLQASRKQQKESKNPDISAQEGRKRAISRLRERKKIQIQQKKKSQIENQRERAEKQIAREEKIHGFIQRQGLQHANIKPRKQISRSPSASVGSDKETDAFSSKNSALRGSVFKGVAVDVKLIHSIVTLNNFRSPSYYIAFEIGKRQQLTKTLPPAPKTSAVEFNETILFEGIELGSFYQGLLQGLVYVHEKNQARSLDKDRLIGVTTIDLNILFSQESSLDDGSCDNICVQNFESVIINDKGSLSGKIVIDALIYQ